MYFHEQSALMMFFLSYLMTRRKSPRIILEEKVWTRVYYLVVDDEVQLIDYFKDTLTEYRIFTSWPLVNAFEDSFPSVIEGFSVNNELQQN